MSKGLNLKQAYLFFRLSRVNLSVNGMGENCVGIYAT